MIAEQVNEFGGTPFRLVRAGGDTPIADDVRLCDVESDSTLVLCVELDKKPITVTCGGQDVLTTSDATLADLVRAYALSASFLDADHPRPFVLRSVKGSDVTIRSIDASKDRNLEAEGIVGQCAVLGQRSAGST